MNGFVPIILLNIIKYLDKHGKSISFLQEKNTCTGFFSCVIVEQIVIKEHIVSLFNCGTFSCIH